MGDIGVEEYQRQVDDALSHVNEIEERVLEIDEFYTTNNKLQADASIKRQEAASREAAATKRMQELIRQFGSILNQISKNRNAWPFSEPVDVKGLGLHDYFEVIKKPMDFNTIKKTMEAKDGSGYKHVREICADVRLVFQNAMKYNDEDNEFHVMAKNLSEKFEEKWRQFLPRVTEEESRHKEEEADVKLNAQLAKEAVYAEMARDISNELYEADIHLEQLRETLVQRCRKMSTEEKRQLGTALTRLSVEDLRGALEIVAQSNPGFVVNAEEVDLDIDALTESTLWRLKFFVKDALQAQGRPVAANGVHSNTDNGENNANINAKRKREICDALTKTVKKKNKKLGS